MPFYSCRVGENAAILCVGAVLVAHRCSLLVAPIAVLLLVAKQCVLLKMYPYFGVMVHDEGTVVFCCGYSLQWSRRENRGCRQRCG